MRTISFLLLTCLATFACADKPLTADVTTKAVLPGKMPREKALIVENANLHQMNLKLMVEKLQAEITAAENVLAKEAAERDEILKEFKIELAALGHTVKLDPKTGTITRTPEPAPPATDKPEKTAKK